MATEIVRYVNPSSAGGDGTTNGLSGPTAAYATLNAWNSAEAKDLVAADENHICYCEGTGSDTVSNLYVSDWACDATRDLQIIGNNTSGKWNESAFRISRPYSSFSDVIRVLNTFVKIKHLQAEIVSGTIDQDNAIINCNNGSAIDHSTVESCIFKIAFGVTVTAPFARFASINSNTKFGNNILYDENSTAEMPFGIICGTWSSNSSFLYQNTILNVTTNGIVRQGDHDVVAKNNIAQDSGSNDYSGTFASGTTNNLSQDGTAPGASPVTSSTLTFEDKINNDYHLDNVNDTNAIGAGADLSADADYPITEDNEGGVRAVPYDIGADQSDVLLLINCEAVSYSATAFDATFDLPIDAEPGTGWHSGEWWASPTYGNPSTWYGSVSNDITLNCDTVAYNTTPYDAEFSVDPPDDITLNCDLVSYSASAYPATFNVIDAAREGGGTQFYGKDDDELSWVQQEALDYNIAQEDKQLMEIVKNITKVLI